MARERQAGAEVVHIHGSQNGFTGQTRTPGGTRPVNNGEVDVQFGTLEDTNLRLEAADWTYACLRVRNGKHSEETATRESSGLQLERRINDIFPFVFI